MRIGAVAVISSVFFFCQSAHNRVTPSSPFVDRNTLDPYCRKWPILLIRLDTLYLSNHSHPLGYPPCIIKYCPVSPPASDASLRPFCVIEIAIQVLTENGMLTIQMRRGAACDEELLRIHYTPIIEKSVRRFLSRSQFINTLPK